MNGKQKTQPRINTNEHKAELENVEGGNKSVGFAFRLIRVCSC